MLVIFIGVHTLNFNILLIFWLLVGLLFSTFVARDTSGDIKKIQRISVSLFILLFAVSCVWNSFNELELWSRTAEFEIVQEFGFYSVEKMDKQEFK